MRNIVLFLNLRTNKKLFLSNRKLAHNLYERICVAEKIPTLSYSWFSHKITQEPVRFGDIEATYAPLHNPLATQSLDDIYQHIVTTAVPIDKVREKLLTGPSLDNAIPMTFGKANPASQNPETDNEQNAPTQ